MPRVSVAEWGKQDNVSKISAYKRLRKMGMEVGPDRKIDAAEASERWERSRDARNGASNPSGLKKSSNPAATHPRSSAAMHYEDKSSLGEAQRAREWIKVKREKLALDVEEGSLVSLQEVGAAQESRAQAEREALLNWPSGIVGTIAAELGCDERIMHRVLDTEIRKFLASRSSQPS